MKYCVKCGTQLEDEQAFCHNCGTKAVSVDEQTNSETSQTNNVATQTNSTTTQTNSTVDEFFAEYIPTPNSDANSTNPYSYVGTDVPYKRSGLSVAASIWLWLSVAAYVFLFGVYLMMGAIIGGEDGMILIVVAFVLLIPLCWTIPMAIKYNKASKKGEEISLAFKLCTLFFVNTIAGILTLVDGNNN